MSDPAPNEPAPDAATPGDSGQSESAQNDSVDARDQPKPLPSEPRSSHLDERGKDDAIDGGAVEIEDGAEPEQPAAVLLDEDEPSLLSPAVRFLEDDTAAGDHAESTPARSLLDEAQDGDSDWDGTADQDARDREDVDSRSLGWRKKLDPHDLMLELKSIETQIRAALEDRDPKRKRKFAGTRRWLELEEDLISLRFSGRIDEDTLRNMQRLITRRHLLVRHLRFISETRPVWNT